MEIDDLFYHDVAFTTLGGQRNVEMDPDDNRDLNNGLYIECDGTCSNCQNNEAQLNFNWREKMTIRIINAEVGVGAFARRFRCQLTNIWEKSLKKL